MIMVIKNEPFSKRKARRLKHDIQTWKVFNWFLVRWKHSNKPNTKGRKMRFQALIKARALVLLAERGRKKIL